MQADMQGSGDIRRLQRLLSTAAGFYSGMPVAAEDGIYGTATRAAVTVFQQMNGLPVTGEADAAVIARLTHISECAAEYFSAPAGIFPFRRESPLRIGSSGSAVGMLQIMINELGRVYENIPPAESSGIYGPMTAEAVKVLQSAWGLVPNGVTDIFTWNRTVLLFSAEYGVRI